MSVIQGSRMLLSGELAENGWVEISGGRFVAVGRGAPPIRPDQVFEGVLAPGLVDLQLNGAFGADWMSGDVDDWMRIITELPGTGTTSFVPTIISAPLEEMAASLMRFRRSSAELRRVSGARPLGMHVEGPFLSQVHRGVHHERYLKRPVREDADVLLSASGEELLYVTLAPELPGADGVIRMLVANGVRVAVGHSDATAAGVAAAVDAGASLVTHLYNAQRGFHHREPGVVGAALTDDRLTVGLIVDGHHISAPAVQVAFACASGRIALVTDATSAMGMAPGSYELGGETIIVADEDSPPTRADGTMAGSTLQMDRAVANSIAWGIDPASALTAAATTPAAAIGRPDLGRIRPGGQADMVLFDDRWRASRTWVGGEVVSGIG